MRALSTQKRRVETPSSDDGQSGGVGKLDTDRARRNWLTTNLFVNHHPWLKRLIHQRSGNHTVAEDVASETFLQVLKLPALEAIDEPRAFLRTIATRILYKIWRRRDLEQACMETLATLYSPDRHSSPEEAALLIEAVQLIDQVLMSLSPKEREIFLLYKIERSTYAQISERHGLSISAVRRVVAKGLRLCLLAMDEE